MDNENLMSFKLSNRSKDSFVGIKSNNEKIEICFPLGYQLSEDEKNLRLDVIILLTVLSRFSKKRDGSLSLEENYLNENENFPVSAYFFIMKNYLARGYYTENEVVYSKNGNGKISWSKTIRKINPIVYDDNFFYLDFIAKKNNKQNEMLLSLIHEYCVYESFKKLGWIFTKSMPKKPRIKLQKNLFLTVLYDKLKISNKDEDRQLLSNMIKMIRFIDNAGEKNDFKYGTYRFEYVWESMIDYCFGVNNKAFYYPNTTWMLNSGNELVNADLKPDTIMIQENRVYILDAKYYKFGVTKKLDDLPGSSSIGKQIIYGEYVYNAEKFKKVHGNELSVFNAFIMPFNSKDIDKGIQHIGESSSSWKSNRESYERVQGFLLDTKKLMSNSIRENKKFINELVDNFDKLKKIDKSS